MINLWILSGVASSLVYLAGRRDAARDPRLTTVALLLLAATPLLAGALPKNPGAPGSVRRDFRRDPHFVR